MMRSAADPSVICDELPAVTRPPSSTGLNDGFSDASFSSDVSRMPSSVDIIAPSASSTGTISFWKRPSLVARAALCCERKPKRSRSSREIFHFSLINSAEMPWFTRPPSALYRSCTRGPIGNPNLPSAIDAPIGTRVITSTPLAMTASYAPAITPCAAKCAACWLEPHWRSTVVPGTDSGHPAASTALRAMLRLCSPTCITQPITTSSTCDGSRLLRLAIALSISAARSTGCQFFRRPLRFPSGVRTASTMTAVGMKVSFCGVLIITDETTDSIVEERGGIRAKSTGRELRYR